jgi:uncharacterized protein (UPF0276 family)
MHFAINYSPAAADLLREGVIQLDYFKCPDWEQLVREAQALRPVYIHFPIVLGAGQASTWDFAAFERWLAQTDTAYLNSHITPLHKHLPMGMLAEDVIETLIREVELLTARFGAERVIVENAPYDDHMQQRGMLELGAAPDTIRQVIEATNTGLLLDLSHAALTCEHTEHDFDEYVSQLPVKRLRELHVTGIGSGQHGERTDHLPLTATDWERLEWVLLKIRRGDWAVPQILALEYGGVGPIFAWRTERSSIAEQVPRLYGLCATVTAG